MKRIEEALTEHSQEMTRSQHVLAEFITTNCEKSAFMSSFELAAVTGISQSTVVRFASMLGYEGYSELQEALQTEVKYRLTTLERLELVADPNNDQELLNALVAVDTRNIRRLLTINTTDALRNLCTRLMLSSRVFIYGQGFTSAAAEYLSAYLSIILPNACCLNHTGFDPLTAMSAIDSGDLLILISYPPHSETVCNLAAFAHDRDACLVTISESNDSIISSSADISLVSECGDYGVGGSLAPVISLCCEIICLMTKENEQAVRRLRAAQEASAYKRS